MKKKCLIRFASIFVLCCLMLILNGCSKVEQRDIHVPTIDSITGIKVGNKASNFESYKSLSENEISDIVDLLKKQNILVDKSVNDNPVNVKNYFAFRLYYIEIPYTGIWEISKDDYGIIVERFNRIFK